MSASSGKVLLIPKGEYDATTQYKVLDWVLYQGRPYVAKQTTTGNAPIYEPTQANPDVYWQLLLDFPTVVDNVPTQNSNNLVKSGGVYDATAGKMNVDGSNITNFTLRSTIGPNFYVDTITKPSGSNQDVTMTSTPGSSATMTAEQMAVFYEARIGDEGIWFWDETTTPYTKYFVIFDSVSVSGSTITITGHLATDSDAAISLSLTQLHGDGNYFNGSLNMIVGDAAITGSESLVVGTDNAVCGDQMFVSGQGNRIKNGYNHGIIGRDNAITAINNSVVVGANNNSGYSDQFIAGVLNNNKSATLFEVGSGSYPNTRKNAFEVYQGGYISMNDGTDKYKFAKSGGVDGFYDGSNNFHPFTGYKELVNNSVVLSTSADTTVTFSDASITADSTIEPFTSVYSIAPKDCVASAGQCVVTIPKQSTAQTIKVKIRVS